MRLLFFCFLVLFGSSLHAQQFFPTISGNQQSGKDEQIQLNEAIIVSSRLFTNDTARYHYNQLKHYVKMILPFVDTAVSMFSGIEQTTSTMSNRNRRKYIRSKEQDIKVNFEDRLRKLNITQGRLLVKLINRQLSMNCYTIVRDLKSPVAAAYYQTAARINGINLNEDYNPEDNRDLEMIMRNLGYERR